MGLDINKVIWFINIIRINRVIGFIRITRVVLEEIMEITDNHETMR